MSGILTGSPGGLAIVTLWRKGVCIRAIVHARASLAAESQAALWMVTAVQFTLNAPVCGVCVCVQRPCSGSHAWYLS